MTNTDSSPSPTSDRSAAGNPVSLTVLRAASALTTLGALAQAAIGGGMLSGATSMLSLHGTLGMITMVGAVVAGVAAGLWAKQGGNTGLMWHALTVAVLGVLQYGIGEMLGRMGGGMEIVHVIIGIIFLVAVIGLATLAFRKPYAANPHGALNESTHHHDAADSDTA